MKADAAAARLRDDHARRAGGAQPGRYLGEQRETTGALPTDRQLVVERFRDELGDWRLCLLSPFGGRVHAPWAMAIEARMAEQGRPCRRSGPTTASPCACLTSPSRPPTSCSCSPGRGRRRADGRPRRLGAVRRPLPRERGARVAAAATAARPAHAAVDAAPAVLRPADGGEPLWLLPDHPRDLPRDPERRLRRAGAEGGAGRDPLARHPRGIGRDTVGPPFATGLLFDYIGTYLYEGDAPLAERRAQALSLDRELLAELLGAEELRGAARPGRHHRPAGAAGAGRRAPGADGGRPARSAATRRRPARRRGGSTHGPARCRDGAVRLAKDRRIVELRLAGEGRWIAIEDVARYRDAFGASPAAGVAETWLQVSETPTARRRSTPCCCAGRGPTVPSPPTRRRVAGHRPVPRAGAPPGPGRAGRRCWKGAFRPGGTEHEFADPDVLRALRRRSLARLRREVEPVPADAFGRFLGVLARYRLGGQGTTGCSR